MKFILSSCLCGLVLLGCANQSKEQKEELKPFVNPPFVGVNVVADQYTVVAEVGDTIRYKSGSLLVFPANAFVDSVGQVVKGNVDVSYREFSDPIDFFIAGISMRYDSAGVEYTFESSGMCELLASQGGKPLQVNPQSKPTVHLRSSSADPAHQMYYLDTIQRKWVIQEPSQIADLTFDNCPAPAISIAAREEEPVKPLKESGERPTFNIVIEPGSVPELAAYDNLKFEVSPDEKNYNPEYGNVLWENVSVERGPKKGTYRVTFSKSDFSISFLALPVVADENYEKAMATYRDKKLAYERMIAEKEELRLKQFKADQKAERQFEEENYQFLLQIERYNIQKRILFLNRSLERAFNEAEKNELEKLLSQALVRLKEFGMTMKDLKSFEKQFEERDRELKLGQGMLNADNEFYRTFNVPLFGILNSDMALRIESIAPIKVKARFVDDLNNVLKFNEIFIVYPNINGLLSNINRYSDYSFHNLQLIPNGGNIIFAVLNYKLYYLTTNDYASYQVNQPSDDYVFKMKVSQDSITSIEQVKNILKL